MAGYLSALERKLALIRKSLKEPEEPDTRERFKAIIADVERLLKKMRKGQRTD